MNTKSKNAITTHQLSVILLIASIALKVLLLPSLLAEYAGNTLYISVIVGYIFEFITLFFILKIMRMCPDKNFFEVLSKCFTKVGAFVISIAYALYYAVKCFYILCETRLFFIETLYEEFSWILFILPLFFLLLFIISKRAKVIARIYESLNMIIIGGFIFLIIVAIADADFSDLLPFMNNGITGVWNALYKNIFMFGDTIILLVFCGRVKFEKDFEHKLRKSIIISAILVTIFMIIYYGIYGNIADMLRFAISSVVQFSPRVSSMGRVDWIAICIWSAVLLLQLILITWLQKTLANDMFNIKKHQTLTGIVITVLLFIITLVYYFNIEFAFIIINSNWAIIIFFILQYFIPIATYIALKI